MGSPSNDDSFVSISLDGKECDICLQDTGQELATCHVCARFLTAGPVQEGFNELPALIHTDTLAHPSCFQKFHKLARRLSHSSPKHQGISQTDDFRSTQWLNFNSNNLGKELLLENIRNRMSRSNPGSRSGSPSFCGGRPLGKPRDAERCSSEPFLDSSAQELHQGYTKYLFGNRETDSGQNVKVPEKRLQPVNPVGDQSCCPSEEVPSSSSNVCNSRTGIDCSLDQRLSKLDSNPLKSCQNEADQYLTKMQSLSIRGKQHQEHNWESPKAKAESRSNGTDSRTMHGCKRTKCGVETDITSCNGNREAKMKDRIAKDVSSSGPPSDDKESWRDVKHIDKESLPYMSVPELRCHIEKLQSAVNDACSQLVQHLEEKDVLSSEVASRHITIKKLVERQKTLHH